MKIGPGSGTVRKPSISSLRRNLQRKYIERLIDLTMPNSGNGEAYKAISNLSMMKLREIDEKIHRHHQRKRATSSARSTPTPSPTSEAKIRHQKLLDAQYIYNQSNNGGGFGGFMFGNTPETQPKP